MEEIKIEKVTFGNISGAVEVELGDLDNKEAKALSFDNSKLAILQAIVDSEEAFTVSVDDKVLGVFGIIDVSLESVKEDTKKGIPWFVCNKALGKYSNGVLAIANGFIKEILKEYQYLSNFVLEDNKLSHEFVRKLGFTIIHDPPIKIGGVNFLEYYMKKE